ncbi:MAG TPA: MarR family transcriptional regulator [Methanoregulaceae archaeon]|nr:MarR family transcriptional regulator [Methanoregulaceae archaeon]HRT14596.1 MarR family transcriptional regulator [Methanoregulaceae archaeon]HRU30167.1 MarR family transcriptional regulator [Methanoregulaceae archaeon]
MPLGALISVIHRNHIIALNTRLRPLGLSASQLPILLFLSHREGIPQEALARHFHLDKATIARAVKRLEDGGFICRKIDPADRRAYGLFLTGKGTEVRDDLRVIDAAWERALLSVVPETNRPVLIRLLRALAEHSIAIAGTGREHGCD